MAVIDTFLQLSGSYSGSTVTPQNVFASGAAVVSTNVVDVTGGSATGQIADIFKGEELELLINVITAFAGGTSAEFQLVSADNAALSTNLTVLASSGAIPIASLGAGKQIRVCGAPQDPRTLRRYVGLNVVNVGANSAGAVLAALTPFDGDLPIPSYSSGFTVN